MAKNLHRVLAIMITVMMVLSMVSVFAFAGDTVAAFAESYSTKYEEKYGKESIISNDAVLVDAAITADEEAAESFTRTWDGIEFAFKFGVNAFKSLAGAYSAGATEIIVISFDSTDSTKFIVKNNTKIYSPAWNEAPMTEMANDNWKAIESNGADWTRNENYFSKTVTVKSIVFDNTVTSEASIYGFSLTKAFTLDAAITTGATFRAPNLEAPVEINIINTYVAPADGNYIDEVFYYTYGDSAGVTATNASNKATFNNKDVLNVKNMWVDRTKFAYNGRGVFPAYTTFDGLYIDFNKRALASNSPLLSSADDSTITIRRSNLRGKVPAGKHFYISSSNVYNTTRVATLENNILWMNSTNAHDSNLNILSPNMSGITKVVVKDNFINRQGSGSSVLLPYFGNVPPSYAYKIEITGNKILALAKSEHLLNGKTLAGSTTIGGNYITATEQTIEPTTENCATLIANAYANEVGYGPTEGATTSEKFNANSINNYYYDYAMTMSSSAFPLVAGTAAIGGETATIDNDASTITFAVGTTSVAKADFTNYAAYNDKIKAEVTDQGFTTVKPTVTIKDMITGTTVDAVDTTKVGLYSLTLAFGSFATKQYTVTVGDFEAPYFDDETNGYVGTTNGPDKNAVLVDASLANEDKGTDIIKVWEGKPYTFVVDINAFATYEAAEAAVADGGKIIVTNLNGGNLNITKKVSVYAPNWNTKPFVVGDATTNAAFDNGTWKATESEAANWTVNETYNASAVNVTDICINADLAGNVGIHGFTVKSHILLGGKTPRSSDANTTNVTISNTVVDSQDLNTYGLFNETSKAAYNNTDTLTFKNVHIKSLAGSSSRMFGDNQHLPAHMVFDGMWLNFDTVGASHGLDQIKSAALDSSITIKNSNFRKASSTSGYYWQFYQATSSSATARKLTFENSILLNSRGSTYGGIGLIQNSYTDVKLDGNFIMDTTAYTGLFQSAASVARFNSVNMTITNNLLLGYSEPNLSVMAGKTVAVVHDNFIVKANHKTLDSYKAVAGSTAKNSALTLKAGTPDRYYYDYAMTKSNVAIEFESDDVLTVEGDTVKVAKDAAITKESIIANAMADAVGTEPSIEVKDIDGTVVDTIDTTESTLYTVTLSFGDIASKEYIINVDNFTVPYFTASAEDGGYVDATGTISNTAILVDTSLSTATAGSVRMKVWEGNPYTFKVGVNAFGSYANAETAATAEGGSKQVIVTNLNGGDLVINKDVSVFSPAWNTVPMDEMAGEYNAIASNGADWNENEDFDANALNINNLVFGAGITQNVNVYGFVIKASIYPSGGNAYSNARTAASATPVTYTIKNSRIDQTTAGQTYGNHYLTVDNDDVFNLKNVQFKKTGALVGDRQLHAHVNYERVYINFSELELLSGTNSNSYLKTAGVNSTLTLKECNFQGTTTANFTLAFSTKRNEAGSSRQINVENSTLKYAAGNPTKRVLSIDDYKITGVKIKDNFIDMSLAPTGTPLIITNTAALAVSAYEDGFVITGNKVIGLDSVQFNTDITSELGKVFTVNNNYVSQTTSQDSAGVALTPPEGTIKDGTSTAYWIDYGMTKSSAALTLGTDSVLTVAGDTVKAEIGAEITKESLIANAMADSTGAEPSIEVKDIDGTVVDTIDTTESTLYTVTLSFGTLASNVYTLNVGDFKIAYFNASAEQGGYVDATGTISNNAILLDTSLVDVAADTEIMKIWDGKRYTFKVNANAFGTYEQAEAAATAEGGSKQIIVTGWDNSAIEVTKAVNIYSSNWNTMPFTRDVQDGEWKAVKSNGAEWIENTTTFDDSLKVAGVVVDSSVSGTVGLYGFYYTGAIDIDGATAGRGGSANKLTVNIVNSKYYSAAKTPINANYKDVTSSDETYIKNFFIKKTTGALFTSEFPAPLTTIEGLYYNLDDLTANAWHKTSSATSKFVIKDSYLFGTSSKAFKVSIKNTAYAEGDTREVVFDNNVMKHTAAGGMMTVEPHDFTTLTITNNYMDKSVDGSALLISSYGVELGKEIATDVTKTITFTGNKIVGFTRALTDAFDAKLNDTQNTVVTIEDNYVTTATSDFENAVGLKLVDDAGNGGNYWVDYNMTQRPCAHPTLNDMPGQDKTCTGDGYTDYKVCADCGEIFGKEVIPAGHGDYVQNKDDKEHWLECEDCQDKKNVEEHIFENDCDTDCSGCEFTRETEHNYEAKFDTEKHWKECTKCGDKIDEVAHIFENDCDTDCSGCEFTRETEHNHEAKFDTEKHWKECTKCGDKIDEVAHIFENDCDTDCSGCEFTRETEHNHETKFDTEKHWKECTKCGDKIDEVAHSFDNACDTTCNGCEFTRETEHNYEAKFDTEKHWKECTKCGDKIDEVAHIFENDCDTDCSGCEFTRETEHNHEAKFDTEKHWKECTKCGDKIDEVAHIFDNDCDTDCSGCEFTRETEHNYETKFDTEKHWEECTKCGKKIDEVAHNFGETCGDKQCIGCDYERDTIHSYEMKFDNEYHWKECSVCHDVVEETTHSIKQADAQQKTCTQDGWEAYEYCEECDYTTKVVIPAGHEFEDVQAKDKTCTEDGYTAHKLCTVCGEKENYEVIPAGHEFEDVQAKDKTCTEDGYTAHKLCTVCGEKENYEVIPASHEFEDVQAKDKTCTEDGYTAHKVCKVCGEKENYEVIPAGHEFEDVQAKDKTCTEDGYTAHKVCKVCGEKENYEVIPAGHEFEDVQAKDKTCTEDGYTAHKVCKVCGEKENYEVIPAGHEFEDVQAKDKTCTEDGYTAHKVCKVCGEKENYEVIPAGHEFEDVQAKDKTCTEDGYTAHKVCKVCGEKENYEVIPAGHEFEDVQAKDKTCTEDGYTAHKVCKVCGEKENYEVIPAGHEFEDVQAKDKTCTEDGYTAHKVCTVCGEKVNYEVIPAGHEFTDVQAKDKTCTEDGYTAHKVCTVCGEKVNYEVIPAGHELTNVPAKDKTCTADGYTAHKACSKCDYKEGYKVIAKGHEFGAYVYNNDATTDNDGTKTRTCSVCGHKETIVAAGTKVPLVNTAEKFTDVVATEWYKEYVDLAYSYGIFKGNEDGTFKPLNNITRAEFVQVLANLSNLDTSNKKLLSKFADVKFGEWYTPAIVWANANGIVAGKSETHFAPDEAITREQMCVMLVNYATFRGISLVAIEAKQVFADDAYISDWARAAVYACQQADIVNGKGELRFDPQNTGIRAEASVIFTKFYKAYLQ